MAGQADALYKHESTGNLCLLDWKRTKAIRVDNPWRSLCEPLENLPDCNGWLYALQLNTYAWILEEEYDAIVSKMFLGHVHPTLGRGRLLDVPKMPEHMQLLVEDMIVRVTLRRVTKSGASGLATCFVSFDMRIRSHAAWP